MYAIRSYYGTVTIQRTGFYSVEYSLKPLDYVAGKTRYMPDEFINDEGNNVTDAFRMYVRPLLGSGFPSAYNLRKHPVDKILNR